MFHTKNDFMKKNKVLGLLLVLMLPMIAFGQQNDLLNFNQERMKVNKTGMTVLGSWALINIGVGAAMVGQAEGAEKSFHQMNIGWNAVNLGIAALGYFQSRKSDPASYSLQETIDENYSMQKVILFNAGLDVGYIASGFYLIERSKNAEENADQLEGFGKSIVLQGGFLLLFDVGFHAFLASKNKKLKTIMENVGVTGNGIGLNIRF
jgi:hypothetical protein